MYQHLIFEMRSHWVAGVVVKKLGSLMYLIQVKSGIFWSCLVDHLVGSSTESK